MNWIRGHHDSIHCLHYQLLHLLERLLLRGHQLNEALLEARGRQEAARAGAHHAGGTTPPAPRRCLRSIAAIAAARWKLAT